MASTIRVDSSYSPSIEKKSRSSAGRNRSPYNIA
jgi:hypothetical protein